jgi:hypothetical protein
VTKRRTRSSGKEEQNENDIFFARAVGLLGFEISKMGLSGLKIKQNDEYIDNLRYFTPILIKETQEDDYNANSGFNDIGLTLGISFDLGK